MSDPIASSFVRVQDLWNSRPVPAGNGPVDLLVHRSNILGADLAVTNFAGGNTSSKVTEADPLTGEPVEVLWVKGSGGDLGTLTREGLASPYLDKLHALKSRYRGLAHEDEMVALLPLCTFNNNPRPASIDTFLHAFLPPRNVDHTHPDSVIAIAASDEGEKLTREIYGDAVGWLPWQRPGFDLGLRLEAAYKERPEMIGLILGGHGLICWDDESRECYRITLELINKAAEFLAARAKGKPFGGVRVAPRAESERRARAAELMPALRGLVSVQQRMIGHFSDDARVLEFVGSADLSQLAQLGTSCPDHFLRTKIWPMVISPDASREQIAADVEAYRQNYAAYFERCRADDSPAMRDASPVVLLSPGVGMFTFAKNKATARIAGEFYTNAINVIKGAEIVSRYVGLAEQEAFNIEYWALEEAKLKRQPPEKSLARRVALVTGAASGIGKAIAQRLAAAGACVVVADINADGAESVAGEIAREVGADNVRAVTVDVTDEQAVTAAFEAAALAFGGLDLLVNNAGLSISEPVDETSTQNYDLMNSVMPRGSFLMSRAFVRQMRAQSLRAVGGGDVIYIVSKNALVAGRDNLAYGTAKAAQLHQARLLAAEVGGDGIRVNVINPDAVIQGSGIWAGAWAEGRAKAYGVEPGELGAYYASRTLLNEEILPEDIAAAVYALVAGDLRKTTGCVIPVDGGLPMAFVR